MYILFLAIHRLGYSVSFPFEVGMVEMFYFYFFSCYCEWDRVPGFLSQPSLYGNRGMFLLIEFCYVQESTKCYKENVYFLKFPLYCIHTQIEGIFSSVLDNSS